VQCLPLRQVERVCYKLKRPSPQRLPDTMLCRDYVVSHIARESRSDPNGAHASAVAQSPQILRVAIHDEADLCLVVNGGLRAVAHAPAPAPVLAPVAMPAPATHPPLPAANPLLPPLLPPATAPQSSTTSNVDKNDEDDEDGEDISGEDDHEPSSTTPPQSLTERVAALEEEVAWHKTKRSEEAAQRRALLVRIEVLESAGITSNSTSV
jgi:hypothetical protein